MLRFHRRQAVARPSYQSVSGRANGQPELRTTVHWRGTQSVQGRSLAKLTFNRDADLR